MVVQNVPLLNCERQVGVMAVYKNTTANVYKRNSILLLYRRGCSIYRVVCLHWICWRSICLQNPSVQSPIPTGIYGWQDLWLPLRTSRWAAYHDHRPNSTAGLDRTACNIVDVLFPRRIFISLLIINSFPSRKIQLYQFLLLWYKVPLSTVMIHSHHRRGKALAVMPSYTPFNHRDSAG